MIGRGWAKERALIGAALLAWMAPVVRAAPPVSAQASDTLPSERYGLSTSPIRAPLIESQAFNEYVPGLQSRGNIHLQPFVAVPHLRVPFLRRGATAPEQANFAIPEWLYVDLKLGSDVTFTDNVYQDNANRQADIVIHGLLNLDVTLQLTDTFQLQLAGNLAYYRALGHSSVSGSGFRDTFAFDDTFRFDDGLRLDGDALFVTQAGWNKDFGAWDVAANDRFSIVNRVMDDPFVGGQFQRATELANVAALSAGRLLPGMLRLGVTGSRGDFLYDSSFARYDRQENAGTVWLNVERTSMRFQPFADYTIRHVRYTSEEIRQVSDGITQEGHLGVRGPVTDNMVAEASLGYGYWVGSVETNGAGIYLTRVSVNHLMNSTTRHQLLIERQLAPAGQALQAERNEVQYKIGHTLTRALVLWLGADTSVYAAEEAETRRTENWSALAHMSYEVSPLVTTALAFEHVRWDASPDGTGYDENRLTVTMNWNI